MPNVDSVPSLPNYAKYQPSVFIFPNIELLYSGILTRLLSYDLTMDRLVPYYQLHFRFYFEILNLILHHIDLMCMILAIHLCILHLL